MKRVDCLESIAVVLFWLFACGNGLTCYSCPAISHARFCDHVQECNSGQLCNLKSVLNAFGDKEFHLGCIDQKLCGVNNSLNHTGSCYTCCESELCNTHGCGEQEITNLRNGPICYNCQGKLLDEQCHKVTFCDYDQMCYLSEFSRFGERFYTSGCKDKSTCVSLQGALPVVGKRNVRSTEFTNCCHGDLCNSIATQAHHHTLIMQTPTMATNNLCMSGQPCLNGATCTESKTNMSSTCQCTDGFFGSRCQYADSRGTKFVLMYTDRFTTSNAEAKILIPSTGRTTMSAYYFHNNMNQTVTLINYMYEYSLNNSVFMKDGLQRAGAELGFDKESSLFALSYSNYTRGGYSDGYMAIPSKFLSNKYIIPSFKVYPSYTSYGSLIALTPVEGNTPTTVNIKLKLESGYVQFGKRTFVNGETLTAVINKHDTLEISHTTDMTGSIVSSSSPVAVVSGNKCTFIVSVSYCNLLTEMILPLNQLDSVYVIPYIETRFRNTVRITSYYRTAVTYTNGSQSHSPTINQESSFDFEHHTISFFRSTENVLVTMYPHEVSSGSAGGAFMLTVQGIEQYLNEYNFVAPNGFTNFISVTVPTAEINGFLLDGKALSVSSVYTISDSKTLIQYSTFAKPVSPGTHYLTHTRKVEFGLWVYGNAQYDAYGFPAGIKFRTIS